MSYEPGDIPVTPDSTTEDFGDTEVLPAITEEHQTDRIMALVTAVTPESTVEEMAKAVNLLHFVEEQCKQARKTLKERMFNRVRALGEFSIGYVRYWIGKGPKSYKCRNNTAAIQAMLTAAAGDEERFALCLSSGWFKIGEVRNLLRDAAMPEMFDSLFETIQNDQLKDDSPTTPRAPKQIGPALQSGDERFMNGGGR